MTAEQWIGLFFGGSFLATVVTYFTTKHRPKVDTSAEQRGWFDQLQEERDKAVERADKAEARANACEDTLRQERMRHDSTERESRARIDDLLRQNGAQAAQVDALAGHVLLLELGVEEATIPPIPAHPYLVRHLLQRDRHANTHAVRDDNGVPGTETNPPPPDDGLPTDPL